MLSTARLVRGMATSVPAVAATTATITARTLDGAAASAIAAPVVDGAAATDIVAPVVGGADAPTRRTVDGPAASASAGSSGVWAAAVAIGDEAADRLAVLSARNKALQAERRQLRTESRLEERKRQRILARARGLSDSDLLGIVGMRAAAKARVTAKPKAKSKAVAKAASTAMLRAPVDVAGEAPVGAAVASGAVGAACDEDGDLDEEGGGAPHAEDRSRCRCTCLGVCTRMCVEHMATVHCICACVALYAYGGVLQRTASGATACGQRATTPA